MIEEVIKNNKSFHHALLIHVNTDMRLDVPIVVKFVSTSRNGTKYSIEYEPTQDIFEVTKEYAGMADVASDILDDIKIILDKLGFLLPPTGGELANKIYELANECIQKCESRYGNPVEDFDLTEYDACLTVN